MNTKEKYENIPHPFIAGFNITVDKERKELEELVERGEKYEKMWEELEEEWGEWGLHHYDIIWDSLSCEMDKLKQKYFPKQICGTCRFYDSDTCFCLIHPKYGELVEQDSCEDWSEDIETAIKKT